MSTPFVSVPAFPPLQTFIATYDIVNDLPQYFVLYEDDYISDGGDGVMLSTIGFFVYDSSIKHANSLLTHISATGGVQFADTGGVSSVSSVNIAGMSINDSVSANGKLYLLIEQSRNNVFLYDYTNRQALRLQDQNRAVLSPFCRSIATNGLMFGYSLSAGWDVEQDSAHNYMVASFYDVSGGYVSVEPVFRMGGTPQISKSGYGYYSFGDPNAAPLGGVYYGPANQFKQAKYNNGTPIVTTLSAADAYTWNLLRNSNVATHTAYVVEEFWTGTALSASLLAINETAFSLSSVFNFDPQVIGVQDISKDGNTILTYNIDDGAMSLVDRVSLSSVDAVEFINNLYPALHDINVQDLFGNALMFGCTMNGNTVTMGIDVNSHVMYIGESTRGEFLRRRLLGYC